MTRATLLSLLARPTALTGADVRALEELAAAFPYCQTAHLLLAKAAHDQDSMLAGQRLRRAATYAADRTLLRQLIELQPAPVEEAVLAAAGPAEAVGNGTAGLPAATEAAPVVLAAPAPTVLEDHPVPELRPVPASATAHDAASLPDATHSSSAAGPAPAPDAAVAAPATASDAAVAAATSAPVVVDVFAVAVPDIASATTETTEAAATSSEAAPAAEVPAASGAVATSDAPATAAPDAAAVPVAATTEAAPTEDNEAVAAATATTAASATTEAEAETPAAEVTQETAAFDTSATAATHRPDTEAASPEAAATGEATDSEATPAAATVVATTASEAASPSAEASAEAEPAFAKAAADSAGTLLAETISDSTEATTEAELPAQAPPVRPPEEAEAARHEFGLAPAEPAHATAYQLPELELAITVPLAPALAPLTPRLPAFQGVPDVAYALAEGSRLGFCLVPVAPAATDQVPAASLPPAGEFFAPDALVTEFVAAQPVPPASPLDLIDSFLQRGISAPRRRLAPPSGEQADLAARSTRAVPELASESLALILVRQGKTEQAITIYERLMVKNPEKMAYFAAQIDQLRPSA